MRIAPHTLQKKLVKDLPHRHAAWAVTVLTLGLGLASMTRADTPRKPTLESVGDQVMCLCGCVATMSHCPHKDNPGFVCYSTWQEMKAVIQKDIAEGKDETSILQDIAIHYGVQVLAAPPAKGFDLTVWILPGVGLFAGLSLVVALVRRWRKPSLAASGVSAMPTDPKLLRAVEDEIKASGMGVRDL